jgi:predicted dehydrogenase
MARSRGRIVLVGVVGLQVPRDEFYRKELTFQVSCSYGPGRYDPAYEEKGQDYPIGYVRWTEQRNFEAVLDMMADGRLDTEVYVSCRFPIAQAAQAYERLDAGGSTLGIVLDYPQGAQPAEKPAYSAAPPTQSHAQRAPAGTVRVAAIGAGNYASRQLIPAFVKAGASLGIVCANGGVSSNYTAGKFGGARVTSNVADVFDAADVDITLVATRHDSHAEFVVRALLAGKAIFVEKPLALTEEQVRDIETAYKEASAPFLMVGFNRRFSPFVVQMKQAVMAAAAPPAIIMTMNAGAMPPSHWTQDLAIGGGRIIGEACHFIDLARHLAGAPIVWSEAVALGETSGDANPEDKAFISLKFANGAVASIQYLANGHKSFPKERIDVFCGGKTWQIDNFRQLNGYGAPGLHSRFLSTQNKGQTAMAAAVVEALRDGKPAPIPVDELLEVARVTIDLDRRLRRL